jgi:hypothetical protein
VRRLLLVLLVLLVPNALGGCSGDDDPQTATTGTTSAPVTTVEVLSLSDKGLAEACADRALDMMDASGTAQPNVEGYVTWLHHSAFAQLHDLADELSQGDPAAVEAAVAELTQICTEVGYELP